MVDTLARTRLEWKAAGDDGAFGGAERIENGLGEPFGPHIRGEGFSIDQDVDAAFSFIWDHANAVL
jgi:hypothetical protein